MDYTQSVVTATQEIFETMLMMEAIPGEPLSKRENPLRATITGMVGMAGGYRGLLAIHTPDAVAKAITSTFLGMEIDDINDDVKDAMGEMANMLAGCVKTSLAKNGKDVKLSIPSAICGQEYTLECPDDGIGVIVPFSLPEGNFTVELRLQEQL